MGADLEIIPHVPEDRKVSEDFDEIREHKESYMYFFSYPSFQKKSLEIPLDSLKLSFFKYSPPKDD